MKYAGIYPGSHYLPTPVLLSAPAQVENQMTGQCSALAKAEREQQTLLLVNTNLSGG